MSNSITIVECCQCKSFFQRKGHCQPFLSEPADRSPSGLETEMMNFPDNLLNWGVWRKWICELRWDGMHPIENANKEIFLLKFSPNGGIRQAVIILMKSLCWTFA